MYLAQVSQSAALDVPSIGLLVVRLVAGLVMSAHGAQKLLGWFGGGGLAKTGAFFAQLGFRPGGLFALTASSGEVISGLLVAMGLLGPIGPALMVSVMIVAAVSVHLPNGLFANNKGIELPLLYIVIGLALAVIGPGRYSLDAALTVRIAWSSTAAWIALGVGVVAAVGVLAVRGRKAA